MTDRSLKNKLVVVVQYYDLSRNNLFAELFDMAKCIEGTADGLTGRVLFD